MYYTYIDFTTEDIPRPFYIGKGNKRRIGKLTRNDLHKNISTQFGCKRIIVFESEIEKEAHNKEIELIALYKTNIKKYKDSFGANKSDGGEGYYVIIRKTDNEIKNKEKERKNKLFVKGKCGTHKDMNVVVGKTICQKCIDKNKLFIEKNKINNKCVGHKDRDVVEGRTLCQECLDSKKINNKIIKKNNFLNGKCRNHSNVAVVPGKKTCQKCLDYAQIRTYINKTNNKCVSHKNRDSVVGRTRCQECLDYEKIYNKYNKKLRREEKLKNGKCPNHKNIDIVFSKRLCQQCLDKKRINSKISRKNKKLINNKES